MKILIVEDNTKLRNELKIFLEKYQYKVECIELFSKTVEQVKEKEADLVLLDVNLPEFDGYHICREIRKESDIPIVIMTSRDTEMDELMSMNLGADDFVSKPFNTEILLARIQNIMKRTGKIEIKKYMICGELKLDISKWQISCGKLNAELTKNEGIILKILMENKEDIVARDRLMDELWQTDSFVDDNTLTVNVNRLRKKMGKIGAERYIHTKRGQGYLISEGAENDL